MSYSESWNIQNSLIITSRRILKTLPYLQKFSNIENSGIFKTDTYSEPSQIFKIGFLAKIVENYNCFSKALYLDSLTCRVTSCYVLYDTYSELCLLSKIQTCSGIFTFYSNIFSYIVTYLEPCVTLADSERCDIQNLGIFRTRDIFRYIQEYSGTFRILSNARILSTLTY